MGAGTLARGLAQRLPSSSNNELNARDFFSDISIDGRHIPRGEHLKFPSPFCVRNLDAENSINEIQGARSLADGAAAGQWPRQQRTLSSWSIA
jgi:hypothetical protein